MRTTVLREVAIAFARMMREHRPRNRTAIVTGRLARHWRCGRPTLGPGRVQCNHQFRRERRLKPRLWWGTSKQSAASALAAQADVSNPAAVRSMFDKTESVYGGDRCVGQQRRHHATGGISRTPRMNSSTVTLPSISRACLTACARRPNVCAPAAASSAFHRSVVGLYQPTYATYAATKAGVEAMTHVLSKELRGRNVTVNVVAPGPTATDLFLQGKVEGADRAIRQALAPRKRLGTPQDIANTVSFLAGPDGSWINGQILRANGGVI